MHRRKKLLDKLPIQDGFGAEIGPLHNPLVAKSDGTVFYVDHADTDTLRARWASDPSVDSARLHVDAVWGQHSLRQAIDRSPLAEQLSLQGKPLDYVVASHVIEHVPDLIGWLREILAVLDAQGSVRLAVPDKRYTFDYLRRTSDMADVMDAFVRQRRAPSGSRVLDFALHMAKVDCVQAWSGKIEPDRLERGYTVEGALALAHDAEHNGRYHDVHCWVFTPASFAALCAGLAHAGLLEFECERLIDTSRNEVEFFVWLRPCSDRQRVLDSWRNAAQCLA